MIIRFKHEFSLPAKEVYSYFQTPVDWTRLYGMAGNTKDLGGGWHRLRKREAARQIGAAV